MRQDTRGIADSKAIRVSVLVGQSRVGVWMDSRSDNVDEKFRNMPSLAPGVPLTRNEEIDHKFWRLFDELDEIKAVVRQLNGDKGNSKLDDLLQKVDFSNSRVDSKGDYVIKMQEIEFNHLNEIQEINFDSLTKTLERNFDHLNEKLDALAEQQDAFAELVANFFMLTCASLGAWWWVTTFKSSWLLWVGVAYFVYFLSRFPSKPKKP